MANALSACFHPLGSGAEFTSSVVPDVADRQNRGSSARRLPWGNAPGFGDLAELVVQRLYGVGRVNDFADGGVEGQERTEAFPVASPQINDRRILSALFGFEVVEGQGGGFDGGRPVDGFERSGDALRSFHEQKRIEFLIRWHHTGLDRGVGPHRLDGVGEACQPVAADHQHVCHAPVLEFGDDAQPEFGAFVSLAQPQTQHVFATVDIDGHGDIDGPFTTT